MFQNVCLSWLVQSNGQKEYFYCDCSKWIAVWPWHNTSIYPSLWRYCFEEFFVTELQDRYDIICAPNDYETANKTGYDSVKSGVGRPIPKGSTTDALKSLCVGLNFMFTWFKYLEDNYVWHFRSYYENMEQLFKKIPLTNPEPTPQDFRYKQKLDLSDIGGKCYAEKWINLYQLFKGFIY